MQLTPIPFDIIVSGTPLYFVLHVVESLQSFFFGFLTEKHTQNLYLIQG